MRNRVIASILLMIALTVTSILALPGKVARSQSAPSCSNWFFPTGSGPWTVASGTTNYSQLNIVSGNPPGLIDTTLSFSSPVTLYSVQFESFRDITTKGINAVAVIGYLGTHAVDGEQATFNESNWHSYTLAFPPNTNIDSLRFVDSLVDADPLLYAGLTSIGLNVLSICTLPVSFVPGTSTATLANSPTPFFLTPSDTPTSLDTPTPSDTPTSGPAPTGLGVFTGPNPQTLTPDPLGSCGDIFNPCGVNPYPTPILPTPALPSPTDVSPGLTSTAHVTETAIPHLTETSVAGDTLTAAPGATGTGIAHITATAAWNGTSTGIAIQTTNIAGTAIGNPTIGAIGTGVGSFGNSISTASTAISGGYSVGGTLVALNATPLGQGAFVANGTPVSIIGFTNDQVSAASDWMSYIKGIGLIGNNKIIGLLMFLFIMVAFVALIKLLIWLFPLVLQFLQFVIRVIAWLATIIMPVITTILDVILSPIVTIGGAILAFLGLI